MVLHDINQAIRYSQDILVLEDGIIKYHGNPVEIMTHETIGEIFKVDADIEIRQGRPSVIVNGCFKSICLNEKGLQQNG